MGPYPKMHEWTLGAPDACLKTLWDLSLSPKAVRSEVEGD